MKAKDDYHIYAMTTILFWSFSYVFTRLALQYFTVFSLGFLRYLFASCALLIYAVIKKLKFPAKKDIPWFLLSGSLGFFFYMITFNQGQKTVTAATGSIMLATGPVITALMASIIYNEKLGFIKCVAIAFEFAGVFVLTVMNSVFSFNLGLVWLLLAAVSLSLYNILQRKLTKSYSALQTSAFSIFFGTILLAIFAPTSVKELAGAPPIQWFYLAVLGVFSSAVAYLSWSIAFSKAKQTSLVTNYMFITPFLTSVLGFLIAGEVPELSTIIGGGIISLGVFIFNFGEKLSNKSTI
jgi:Predicted permeases